MADIQKKEEMRKKVSLLFPNKTGYTEALGYCSCGDFHIHQYGICYRCINELEKQSAEKATNEKATNEQQSFENQERKHVMEGKYHETLHDANQVIKELCSVVEQTSTSNDSKQKKRIERAKQVIGS